MRASFKRPRVEPFDVASPPPFSTGDTNAEESVDHAAADVPPPFISDDLDI